jgi:hypothetical protein
MPTICCIIGFDIIADIADGSIAAPPKAAIGLENGSACAVVGAAPGVALGAEVEARAAPEVIQIRHQRSCYAIARVPPAHGFGKADVFGADDGPVTLALEAVLAADAQGFPCNCAASCAACMSGSYRPVG